MARLGKRTGPSLLKDPALEARSVGGRLAFPLLSLADYDVTSPQDPAYNCIAWAMGDTEHWWWPEPRGGYFWPPGVPTVAEVMSFERAFATVGYARCDGPDLEDGIEKLALYLNEVGRPTHAAYQRADGAWLSKIGASEDIVHVELAALDGPVYGSATHYFARGRQEHPGC